MTKLQLIIEKKSCKEYIHKAYKFYMHRKFFPVCIKDKPYIFVTLWKFLTVKFSDCDKKGGSKINCGRKCFDRPHLTFIIIFFPPYIFIAFECKKISFPPVFISLCFLLLFFYGSRKRVKGREEGEKWKGDGAKIQDLKQ